MEQEMQGRHAGSLIAQGDYADLEIRIYKAEARGYPVDITVNHELQYERGYLDSTILPWVSSASSADDGKRLFELLFHDDRLKKAWVEVRGQSPQRRVRLRIDAAAPELHVIPWELLRDPGDGGVAYYLAAATATPFSRYLAGRWHPGSPILKRPIRVLAAVANPQNLLTKSRLATICVEDEIESLREATAGLAVELVSLPQPCTLPVLEAELRKGYHILHLVAHGAYSEQAGQAALFLADKQNQVARVLDVDFADMLACQLADTQVKNEQKLRLVFLASCQTAQQNPTDAFRGLAPALIAAGVPAVLAMQDLVPVDTARLFAATFYQQLLQHGQVDLATNQARLALLAAGLPGAAIPVLFSRLRGSQLLGQRGRVTSYRKDRFWPTLLRYIELQQCTPFLGPGVRTGLLPDRETLAEELADRYGYPLCDRGNLARVAQFMNINAPGLLHQDYLDLMKRSLFNYLDIKPTPQQMRDLSRVSLTKTIEELDWAKRVLSVHEDELHHLLADLRLPLYVTTNVDNFMSEALKHRGLSPRRLGPRWEQPKAGIPQYVLTPEPNPDQPVVFHLTGHDGDPDQLRHLVLSEDEYLANFVRLSRDQETILPMNMLGMLSEHSFLFLGYQLDDWEFRTILQGLIQPIAQTSRAGKLHVGVQLGVKGAVSEVKAMEYLSRYLGQFSIDIYWGTAQQFVTELYGLWQEHLQHGWDN